MVRFESDLVVNFSSIFKHVWWSMELFGTQCNCVLDFCMACGPGQSALCMKI
jgi:hypothetical protein